MAGRLTCCAHSTLEALTRLTRCCASSPISQMVVVGRGESCATLPAGDRPPKQTFGCAPTDFVLAILSKCTQISSLSQLGNFNALRVATEDYLRSTRIFKTTSAGNTHDEDSMEVDAVSRKGKGKEKSGKGKKGGKKGKEIHSGKGYGETTTEHSRFDGEC